MDESYTLTERYSMRAKVEKEKFEDIDFLRQRPLLQSGNLQSADVIKNPESLGQNFLYSALDLGRKYTAAWGYKAVAFTQINPVILTRFVGRPDLTNIIYFNDDDSTDKYLQDSLVLNPELESHSDYYFIKHEGCGTILGLKEVAKRYMTAKINCLVYNPPMNLPINSTLFLAGESASDMQHEMIHLLGQDITDYPESLVDFSIPGKQWENCRQTYEEIFNPIRNQYEFCRWLVHRNGRFMVVNQYGKYLEDYAKPGK